MTKMGSDLHALTKRFSKFIVNVKREFPIGILYLQCQNITLCGRGEKDRDFLKKYFTVMMIVSPTYFLSTCESQGCCKTCAIDRRSLGNGFNMATIRSLDSLDVVTGKNQCGPKKCRSSASVMVVLSAALPLDLLPSAVRTSSYHFR